MRGLPDFARRRPDFRTRTGGFQERIVRRRRPVGTNVDDLAQMIVERLDRQRLPAVRGVVAQRHEQASVFRFDDAAPDIDDRGAARSRPDLMKDGCDTIQPRRFIGKKPRPRHGQPRAAIRAFAVTEIDHARGGEVARHHDIEQAGLPLAYTAGTPPIGGDTRPLRTRRRRPVRSVTSISPLGRNARDHGYSRLLATVDRTTSPAEVAKMISSALPGPFNANNSAPEANSVLSVFIAPIAPHCRSDEVDYEVKAKIRSIILREQPPREGHSSSRCCDTPVIGADEVPCKQAERPFDDQ